MEQVSYLLAFLVNRWSSSFAGIAIASTMVWYLGPLIPGFRQPLTRALLILAVVMVWAVVNSIVTWRRRRRERALAAGVTGGATDGRDPKADAAEEVSLLRDRMQAALKRLRGNRRRGYLYEQPWFVLIGPPGSGKTTALLNSGLHFPLAQDDGADAAIGGVGGTRLCDWWFADEAVLIDTAGRYTTQDSDATVDRAGWEGFLDLLRRTRPRQQVNGVIVFISVTDIAAASAAERAEHAKTVRRRVTEISERLRLRVPVYVVFSKADRLTGFNEYFDDLDVEARTQVWGMTFPLAKGVQEFAPEFRLLVDRLNERLFERLQAERAPDRRALLAGFPLQIASLAQPLNEFLVRAFSGTKLDPAPFLRGVYMSSATQEGTPIDQLTSMLARAFGVDQKRAPSLRPVAGRSYFLKRLVGEVVLGEALLVTRNSARHRRWRWIRIGGFATVGVATIAGALVLWRIGAANRAAVTQATVTLAAYRSQLNQVTLDPISNDELTRVSPLLDTAAALPRADGIWLTGFPGLSQGEKLVQSDRLIERNALQQILLPRLIWRLEAQMRARFSDPDFLYEATRVYLMLGSAGPLDRTLVHNWEILDWRERFPGALNQTLRDHLAVQLDALLADPLPMITLDGGLVSAARATFSRVPLAERVYSRIKADASTDAIPDWTPAEALGPAGIQLFTRPSGKPLTEGISGFYTADGFRKLLLGHLAATTRSVAEESWVLGRAQEIPSEGPAVDALEHAVIALYIADFEKQWDALLGDITLVPLGNHESAVQRLYVLSSPQSPMRDLLVAIAHELTLQPPTVPGQPASDTHLAAVVSNTAQASDASSHSARDAFAQHYAGLQALVGGGEPQAPLAGVLRLVNSLQVELAQTGPATTNVPASLLGSGDPVQLLSAEAQRQQAPMSQWLRQIADDGRAALSGNAQAAAAAAFSASTGPGALCRSVVAGHYPFDPASGNDAPLDDFARLFAPNGLLDAFFETQIKPYVDMNGSTWRPRAVGGIAPPVDAATVASFQRAAAIRDAYFPTGGTEPQLRFTIAPLSVDPTTKQATLTLGAATITDTGQDAPATSVVWPGNDGPAHAALAFDPGTDAPSLAADGPWALFRLFGRGQMTPGSGPEAFGLSFHSGEQRASFTLEAGSTHNPFGHNLVAGFRCPAIR